MKIDLGKIASTLNLSGVYSGEYTILGLVNSPTMGTLTFMDDKKFIPELELNVNITGVIVLPEIAKKIVRKNLAIYITDSPRYDFYKLYNAIAIETYQHFDSKIAASAVIHPRAYVAANNVVIGENVYVGANASILADVEIGNNCIIKEGVVLGCEGFELKRTSKGIVSVVHDGKLLISDNVYIGNNSTIYKGFAFRNTLIGEGTRIDNLVYIAHGVWIGKECFIIGQAMVSGSCELGDKVLIGPGVIVSNQIKIGDRASLTIGSVVTKHVNADQKVTGNFAIDHEKFMQNLKKNL